MATFVFRLQAPRPPFTFDMTDENEDESRAFAPGDPVPTTGPARMEMGKLLAGNVRSR